MPSLLYTFCYGTDSSNSHPPPIMGRFTTRYRSMEQLDYITEDDIIMKKKWGGSILKNQVTDINKLESHTQRVFLHVTGMSCSSCVNNIESHMIKKPGQQYITCMVAMHDITGCYVGVHEVRVGLLAEKAEIVYDPILTNPDALTHHMHSLGFGAEILVGEAPTEHKLSLIVSHMI